MIIAFLCNIVIIQDIKCSFSLKNEYVEIYKNTENQEQNIPKWHYNKHSKNLVDIQHLQYYIKKN